MKRTLIFYIRTTLLLIGFGSLLISALTPITKTTTYLGSDSSLFDNYDYLGNKQIHHYTYGLMSLMYWYTSAIPALAIFAIGYFKTRIVNTVLVLIFTPLCGMAVLFLARFGEYILTPNKGPVKIIHFENGYFFALIGGFLVAIATCVFVLGKEDNSFNSKDLLDRN